MSKRQAVAVYIDPAFSLITVDCRQARCGFSLLKMLAESYKSLSNGNTKEFEVSWMNRVYWYAFISLFFAAGSAHGSRGLVFVTDVLPDDLEALAGLAYEFRDHSQDLFVVTADGYQSEKAAVVRTLLDEWGLHSATVVNGHSNSDPGLPYQANYQKFSRHLLKAISQDHKDLWDPVPEEYISGLLHDFVLSRKSEVDLLLAANPAALGDKILQGPVFEKLGSIYAMGFWKRAGAEVISAFNANSNISFTREFLAALHKKGQSLIHLPSEKAFLENTPAIDKMMRSRRKLIEESDVFRKVVEAVDRFRVKLDGGLTQQNGIAAPFISTWDPYHQMWDQDVILTTLALGKASFQDKPFGVSISDRLDGFGIGYIVALEAKEDLVIKEIEAFDSIQISQFMENTYSSLNEMKALPAAPPSGTPLVLMVKSSIDELGLVMSLRSQLDRVELILPEFDEKGFVAKIYETLSRILGLDGVVGDSFWYPQIDPNTLGLEVEQKLFDQLSVGEGYLSQWERFYPEPRKLDLDTSNQRAFESLVKTLDSYHEGVEVVSAGNLYLLEQLCDHRPDLLSNISKLHLKGGGRVSRIPNILQMSRNWGISPRGTQRVIECLQVFQVPTLIYDKSNTGGVMQFIEEKFSTYAPPHQDPAIEAFDAYRKEYTAAINDHYCSRLPDENLGAPRGYRIAQHILSQKLNSSHSHSVPVRLTFNVQGNSSWFKYQIDPSASGGSSLRLVMPLCGFQEQDFYQHVKLGLAPSFLTKK